MKYQSQRRQKDRLKHKLDRTTSGGLDRTTISDIDRTQIGQSKLSELRGLINSIEHKQVDYKEDVQPYIKGKRYQPGERVMYKGKVIIAPEVDADGYEIWQ